MKMRLLIRRRSCPLIISALLLATAHRLPAPIQESPESPTPAPEQSAKPKPKRMSTPIVTSENSESSTKRRKPSSTPKAQTIPNPTPFAGTWVGKKGWAAGVTIVVSPAQDSAVAKSVGGIWGDRGGQATVNGNTLRWNFLAEKWVMIITPDGKTAVVTDYGWPSGSSSGTFEKLP